MEKYSRCAIKFISVALKGKNTNPTEIRPRDIEILLLEKFKDRSKYFDMLAKIILHLSSQTKTGRISYSFQQIVLFGDHSKIFDMKNEDLFPELYKNDLLTTSEFKSIENTMEIEYAVLRGAVEKVAISCCDSQVCSLDQTETFFEKEGFYSSLMNMVCFKYKMYFWSPVEDTINIPLSHKIYCFSINEIINKLAQTKDDDVVYYTESDDPTKIPMDEKIVSDMRNRYKIEIKCRRFFLSL